MKKKQEEKNCLSCRAYREGYGCLLLRGLHKKVENTCSYFDQGEYDDKITSESEESIADSS